MGQGMFGQRHVGKSLSNIVTMSREGRRRYLGNLTLHITNCHLIELNYLKGPFF